MIAREPRVNLRRLIWLYFWLLIFEGALRKWIVPQLANPLLIVRDPVVIAAYAYAIQKRLFPSRLFLTIAIVLAFLSTLASLSLIDLPIFVTLFGIRTNFLHLPFIFLIADTFDSDDVRAMGRAFLIISMPMAVLMVLQFKAPASSFLNTGAGEGAGQITSALGKVRAPGTFSYILGPVFYFGMVAAFLIHGALRPGYYPKWLLGGSCLGLVAASVVSGSRSLLVNVGMVFVTGLVGVLCIRPRLLAKFSKALVLLALAVAGSSLFGFFSEGFHVMSVRVEDAGNIEGGAHGFLWRALSAYITPVGKLMDAPLLGCGLGMGTNAGAAILTGKAQFLLAEGEWDRLVMESGPLLGSGMILWRTAFVLWLAILSMRVARSGNFLPLLLCSATFLLMLNGGWGAPTILGFTVLGSGLCLAGMRNRYHPESVNAEPCLVG